MAINHNESTLLDTIINFSHQFEIEENEKEVESINNKLKLIDEKFKNKSGSEIANYLLSAEASELGGITALSGFYYQILVTIEYVIEMLEGKWDFVIMEYHDDVIVGKDERIQYVQVKTSGEILVEATSSPASGLYYRSLKTIEDKKYKQANSWIDKLFKNSLITRKKDGFKTEFILYTSYHLIKTKTLDVDVYTGNQKFNIDQVFDENGKLIDSLFVKLTEDKVFDKSGQEIDFSNFFDESLELLLKRLYIKKGHALNEIEAFRNNLCMKLNDVIFKDFGSNVSITSFDLNHIIGYLFEKCVDKNSIEKLVITPRNLEELLVNLREQTFQKASKTISVHNSKSVFEDAINVMAEQIEDTKHEQVIKKVIYDYKEYLDSWVKDDNGNVIDLVHRLLSGSKNSQLYKKIDVSVRNIGISEFFTLSIMISLISKSKMKFDNVDFFLTKISEGNEIVFYFYRMEPKKRPEIAIRKIKDILGAKDSLELLTYGEQAINIVLQNYNGSAFNKVEKHEVNVTSFNFDDEDSPQKLTESPFIINLFPGEMMSEIFIDGLDEEDMNSYLNEKMEDIKR